jgi:hypothetical protein
MKFLIKKCSPVCFSLMSLKLKYLNQNLVLEGPLNEIYEIYL